MDAACEGNRLRAVASDSLIAILALEAVGIGDVEEREEGSDVGVVSAEHGQFLAEISIDELAHVLNHSLNDGGAGHPGPLARVHKYQEVVLHELELLEVQRSEVRRQFPAQVHVRHYYVVELHQAVEIVVEQRNLEHIAHAVGEELVLSLQECDFSGDCLGSLGDELFFEGTGLEVGPAWPDGYWLIGCVQRWLFLIKRGGSLERRPQELLVYWRQLLAFAQRKPPTHVCICRLNASRAGTLNEDLDLVRVERAMQAKRLLVVLAQI